jgi:hypothetical protein
MAVQKQDEPAIRVDKARKYPTSAGQCDKCGYFKTWAFKIVNPKSGKQVPGHVTKEGFKINDGDCPFYSLLKRKAEGQPAGEFTGEPEPRADGSNREPLDLETPAPKPAATAAKPAATRKAATQGGEQRFQLAFSRDDDTITATIGPCATKMSKADAVLAVKVLLDLLVDE